MTLSLPRRRLFGFGAALIAAPSIVRASSLMAVRPMPEDYVRVYYRGGAMNDVPPYAGFLRITNVGPRRLYVGTGGEYAVVECDATIEWAT